MTYTKKNGERIVRLGLVLQEALKVAADEAAWKGRQSAAEWIRDAMIEKLAREKKDN
jgi:hypothetical protein